MVTSKKTGIAPYCKIGFTVVGKEAATVITSSPGFIASSPSSFAVKAEKATKLAEEPEFTVNTDLTLIYLASFFSNSALNFPVVNQASKAE